jgi:aspartyl-tRNA(Asn)/glutamyl-tRNA(Gln) amidotransferase subunit A
MAKMFKTVIEKRDAIVSGAYAAKENIIQLLELIEKKNPDINALLSVNKKAIEAAEVVDEKIRQKQKVGKLAGLGVVVKACISTEGQETNCASKTLEGYKATYDADVVRRLREEDAIILGIANMDEFAGGASGETSAYGATDNPRAPGRVPGGSSSGSAAAVASGMCDLALGTDTGGSIRNPASHCGIVGIKPSYGRVSRYGLIDLAMSLDQVGTLAQDVTGAALLLEVIAGWSANDPTTVEEDVQTYTKFTKPQKITIGICPSFKKLCSDERIWEMVEGQTRAIAKEKGWTIKEVELPHADLAVQAYYPLVYVEFFSGTRKFDGRKYGKKIEDAAGSEVLRRILGGQEVSRAEYEGQYYRKALEVKAMITVSVERAFDEVDVIMLPPVPRLPHYMEEEISVEDMYGYDVFTTPANLTGICAGVVPIATIDDVPMGLQVYAPAFRERILFDVMKVIEDETRKQSDKSSKDR